jgi:hypothetical protein
MKQFRILGLNIVILITTLVLLAGCSHNPLDIDVSGVSVPPVKIDRLEKDMFTMPKDSVAEFTPKMMNKYGRFYSNLVISFINDGGIRDSTYTQSLRRFVSDATMRGVYDSCEKVYPDVTFLETGLTDAFKHFKYYFPDSSLPRVVTVMTGFNYSLIYYNRTLAISLERYLGARDSFYIMLQYPKYKTRRMSKDYVLDDAVYGWLESLYKPNEDKHDLLSAIVHEGKIMYMLDATLPKTDDTIKIGYSKKQLTWCKDNEFNLWAYIIQQKLLYTTDDGEVKKFTSDGPFTQGFNKDFCPARTGNWLGWQLVRSYMKHNSSVTLKELMETKNADLILQRSGYKPTK